jgi:hypothetical protein
MQTVPNVSHWSIFDITVSFSLDKTCAGEFQALLFRFQVQIQKQTKHSDWNIQKIEREMRKVWGHSER